MWPSLFKSMTLIEKKRSAFNLFIFLGVRVFFGIATMTYRFMYTQNDLLFFGCRIFHNFFYSSFSLNACNWTATTFSVHFLCLTRCIQSVWESERFAQDWHGLVHFNTRWDKGISAVNFIFFIHFGFFPSFSMHTQKDVYYFLFGNHHFCGLTAFVCANTCIVVRSYCIASHRIEKALWILHRIFPIMFGSQVFLCSFYIDVCVCVRLPIRSPKFVCFFSSFFGVCLAFSYVSLCIFHRSLLESFIFYLFLIRSSYIIVIEYSSLFCCCLDSFRVLTIHSTSFRWR